MSTLKRLEEANVVLFELLEAKKRFIVTELCDHYYDVELTRSELSVLIDELTELRDQMVGEAQVLRRCDHGYIDEFGNELFCSIKKCK